MQIPLRNFCVKRLLCVVIAVPAMSSANVLMIDQVTDSALVSGHTILGTAVTFETWYMPTSTLNTPGMIFNEWRFVTEDKQFGVGGNRNYGFLAGASSGEFDTTTSLTLNQWHHIAYVYDGSSQRLYLDGTLARTGAGSGDPKDDDQSGSGNGLAYMGRNPRDGENKLSATGLIDAFRLSSTVRYTGAQFAVPGRNFVVDQFSEIQYEFDVPIGTTTIPDLSGKGHHLLLNNRHFLSTPFTVVADPIPEPEPATLVAVAAGLFGSLRRRSARTS
jgi:hypothetical protein